MANANELEFAPVSLEDLDIIAALEAISFHPDEAASKEQLAKRIGYATQEDDALMAVARYHGQLVGYIATTLTNASLVTDESMSSHEPGGQTVCLHGVCIAPEYRGRGWAVALMRYWIQQLKRKNKYKRIALLSRPQLTGLYETVGFRTLGKSQVVHGPEPWYDCILDLS
ncbi:hypothetical protein EC973_006128 [Apophysomyces ossiformis]|uniref:N-acetyltransferase domain-containing protein n=1 Tax=Apophysomyces ossiformis TaxID=679940 RepID=A0A8H7BZ00_9FUNG|nr:hypothetical protein EC973_006128 [Apophysomyces ossiformis]